MKRKKRKEKRRKKKEERRKKKDKRRKALITGKGYLDFFLITLFKDSILMLYLFKTQKMKVISVAIVEDIKEIREGLQALIHGSEGYECTLTFSTGEDAVNEIPFIRPDVVLMDINLPGMNGIECMKKLKEKCTGTLFIMSTIYEDDENIFDSLKAGASGYLIKKTSPVKILEAISDVVNGGSPMSGGVARKVIGTFQKKDTIDDADVFTPKEKEILKSLAKGLRYKEIAFNMVISIETVRSHVRNIYEKLQVQSRTEALNKIKGI